MPGGRDPLKKCANVQRIQDAAHHHHDCHAQASLQTRTFSRAACSEQWGVPHTCHPTSLFALVLLCECLHNALPAHCDGADPQVPSTQIGVTHASCRRRLAPTWPLKRRKTRISISFYYTISSQDSRSETSKDFGIFAAASRGHVLSLMIFPGTLCTESAPTFLGA